MKLLKIDSLVSGFLCVCVLIQYQDFEIQPYFGRYYLFPCIAVKCFTL